MRYAGVVFSGIANYPDRLGNGLDGCSLPGVCHPATPIEKSSSDPLAAEDDYAHGPSADRRPDVSYREVFKDAEFIWTRNIRLDNLVLARFTAKGPRTAVR